MDLITLATAKAYTDSRQLAYSEGENLTIAFDGDNTGKHVVGNFAKISDKTPDFNTLVRTVQSARSDDGTVDDTEYLKDFYVVYETEYGQELRYKSNKNIMAIAVKEPYEGYEVGLYVLSCKGRFGWTYYSILEFAETIHPIEAKYLPDTIATKDDIFGAMEASY